MKLLNNVTLVCVTSIKIEDSIQSLIHTQNQIKFAETKLITHESVINPNFKTEKCRKLTSSEAYSHFIIFDLYRHIDTEFCLVINHDGFIINADLWSDEFLNYDYIGSPWPMKENDYIDPRGNHIRVGNGGFSIRSKRSLEVSSKEYIPFAGTIHGDYYKHHNTNWVGEDYVICVHNHELYEKHGCKFAPLEIASKFGIETRNLNDIASKHTFGVHGISIVDYTNTQFGQ